MARQERAKGETQGYIAIREPQNTSLQNRLEEGSHGKRSQHYIAPGHRRRHQPGANYCGYPDAVQPAGQEQRPRLPAGLGAGSGGGRQHCTGARKSGQDLERLASLTVAGLVLYYLFAGQSAEKILTTWKAWFVTNNATAMFILLLVLGVVLIGEGLGGLIG